ncbi:autotransporter outer membrane beta-barrel domain-containing protein [Pantoea sp. Bo_2]|uniref:Autotransporter outer membrane beta-barrel domain-containing protein n=1 Tax=Candidatus Pantoea gossypiicola TaxID=2608008 RepID=A0AB34CDD3_9GAMM|nr:autotransporter outer membrane beta-barrel domain-containing protein [Pantoea sp. VH_8]KAA5929994.1 autotransporter outer membrane beta-barrel domain-containing protein [Pantoea sp. VH_4]KAA5937470.1 autotransporter outer membrane beta-barrel domain-containing protein [Pantoea sp. VH_3]KAA5946532.1 autotransporter outer membrane beta-barrel domain-containing protein [Pantoea sp. VH_25]KAA5951262.1 autotransporter outer membrane beta-barrel domain-containing protein [Pantoea sp. VH_24]KAA595
MLMPPVKRAPLRPTRHGRIFLRGRSKKDTGTGTAREFVPFAEVNWIYQTGETGVRMNGAENHLTGVRNLGRGGQD